jgi:hypothetical protein
MQVVLPEPVATQLQELAATADEPASTLAGQMVRGAVAQAAADGKVRPVRPVSTRRGVRIGSRPRWLEPYGGDTAWSREMWGSVVALHARYPRYLESIKDGWWLDEAHTETLCALATWRAEIDDAAEDPREELAFHAQLHEYARILREQGGGVAATWQPGAPPQEWIGLRES